MIDLYKYTKKILIRENITPEIKKFISENFNGAAGCIICDYNTYQAAENIIKDLNCGVVCFELDSYHADEFMVEMYDQAIEDKYYDYFIACGAGTIHDLTRIIAHKYNKPFISLPTAASVDGFVSDIAPLTTTSGMKITLPSVAPVALFADIDILASAPRRLTASGTGDIIGKYTALADWRMANLLTGEKIHEDIINLEYEAIKNLRMALTEFAENDNNRELYKKFCAKLLDALVLTGLCMQAMGNSRPASGAEHHIAHFFEMDILEKNNYLHGENVAIGTVFCAEQYHKFADAENISFIENYALDMRLIEKYYGSLSGEIIKENSPAYLHQITPDIFYENIDGIKNIIKDIPPACEIKKILSHISDEFSDMCDIPGEVKELVLKLAPYVRNRFTLLKLCRCLEF
jgi:glycerol-1-phosphate dehydrogenase [NAD(P)+]